MKEYRRFLAIWECIHKMNNAGIYCYGYATSDDGNYKIVFDCDNERIAYDAVFSN